MCNRRDGVLWGEVVEARQGHLIGHDSCRAAIMMVPFPAQDAKLLWQRERR